MKRRKRKEYVRIRGDSGQRRRIFAVALVLGLAAFLPVSLRLYHLMVLSYDYYAEKALNNQTRSTSVTASRGNIYDRNMNILAAAKSVENIYLDPHELKQSQADMEDISQMLGQILDLDSGWILEQSRDITKRYKQIAARVDEETAGKIRSRKERFAVTIQTMQSHHGNRQYPECNASLPVSKFQ